MKTSQQIRDEFLDFFRGKGHEIVPSASLLPVGDKTLLFTNAGMNQFKDVFLNTGTRPYKRAADTQKCMRVSGKHNDLDDVGKDTYHHTLFEMLGNWSFGDYYKAEAIQWAWELFTATWGLDKSRLYATVYKKDDEAFDLWTKVTDIDPAHVMRFAEKDNFWEMGETGPCGPCSEIHIDLGAANCDKQHVPGHVCAVNAGCARYIELWNLVFIQYNREADGSLKELPAKHVDTGMGFERICCVLQGKTSNYDTDVFTPLLDKVAALSGKKYAGDDAMPMRVVADHVRALSFAIADGIMPSNEGRGYVLRRILRRALRYAERIGLEKPFLGELVPVLAETMGHVFPELGKEKTRVMEVLRHEEERFFNTVQSGMRDLTAAIAGIKYKGGTVLPGELIFQLYDSKGFPAEIAEEVAKDEELEFDRAGFEKLMQEQKDRGRSSWKGAQEDAFAFFQGAFPATHLNESTINLASVLPEISLGTTVALLLTDTAVVDNLLPGQAGYFVSPETIFYPEQGGQVADKGTVRWDGGWAVVDGSFKKGNAIVHNVRIEEGTLAKGAAIHLQIDDPSRKLHIARHHTATHLLQAALLQVLGDHVAQAGSLVEEYRLRFDFSHFKAITRAELDEVETIVNGKIRENIEIDKHVMDKERAIRSGAKAFFGEKYDDQVRVVRVGDFSVELCGGSHVERTGDIGLVKIVAESSIASGIRRVEAVAGKAAFALFQKTANALAGIGVDLNASADEVPARVKALAERVRQLEKDLAKGAASRAQAGLADIAAKAPEKNGVKIVRARLDGVDAKVMKEAVDAVKNQCKDCVVIVGGEQDGKVLFVVGCAGAALAKGADAKKIANEAAALAGGTGGGRPDMAQAGAKDAAKIDAALDRGAAAAAEALG